MSKSKPLPPLRVPKPSEMEMSRPFSIVATSEGFEHCCKFCNETSFDLLSLSMQSERWELVSVVPHRKYVSTGGGNGYSDGWMTFWKRIRQAKEQ